MSIVAEDFPVVVGVDTHARSNTYAIITTRTGARLDAAAFPSSQAGIARALSWIMRRCQGVRPLLVIEGIGSYGAALARAAAGQGLEVVEPLPYSPRRRGPKNDTIDAEAIGRSVVGVDEALLRRPRSHDAIRTGLRVLVVAREELNAERTRSINALTALVRSVDLGLDARRALSGSQISTIARWRARSEDLGLAKARARVDQAGPADHLGRRGAGSQQDRACRTGCRLGISSPSRRGGHRRHQRRRHPGGLVPSRAYPLRGRFCIPLGHLPHSRLLGQHLSPPPEPWRGPASQPGALIHRPYQDVL